MRPYRGLTKDGKWVYGWYFGIWEQAYILWGTTNDIPNMIEVLPETVGQQIGRKDKSNVEIYERDVIRGIWQVDHKTIVTGIVKYYPDYGLYALENDKLNIVSVIWDTCEVLEAPNERKP